MPQQLQETAKLNAIAIAEAKKTGRMLIQHISPGWGSSGYYSADVLEEAATNQVIPAGTHMYADHPTPDEAKARPVRSIKDLMSVTTEAARVATEDDVSRGAELGALVSEVDVVPTYRELLEHLKDSIGVSVRGAGDVLEGGTAEGRTGRIVESLEYVQSVDWVTRPGRGGKVLSLVESARANQRAIEHGVEEATVNDTREALDTVLSDAYGGKDRGAYVRDFEETDEGNTVWFSAYENGENAMYAQSYTKSDNGAVTLTGDRTEVRVVTKYVSATRPDSTTTATEESQEDTMGKIQIEESEHVTLTEKAGRVDALIQENATKDVRIKELEEADAKRVRTDRATAIVEARAKEADVAYTPREVKGFLYDLPLKEDGALDEAAFTTAVDEDAATRKADTGAGLIIGHGGKPITEGGTVTLAQIDEALGLKTGV